MKVLGIETSCDETGIAVFDSEHGLLGHALYSQVELHADYGGVVPELASRDHVRKIIPLIDEVMAKTGLQRSAIDAVAYTEGPGLVGALLVGAAVGRSIAWTLGVPHIGVHHMEGHLLAPLLEEVAPEFPFVALLVSGGHTMLVEVQAIGQYRILGDTLDDAVGEAFDKTAKMLGLGYPGGPIIEKLAEGGDPGRFHFPRPMCDRPGLQFSFSGLKTFTLNIHQQYGGDEQSKRDIARGFQDAVMDTLAIKCRRALQETALRRLVVAGGVSANQALRKRFDAMAKKEHAEVFYPGMMFCTDNGAMIAFAGCQRLLAGERGGDGFNARPRWSLEELASP